MIALKTLIDLLEQRVSAKGQAPLYAFLDPACCVREAFRYEEFMQKTALLGEALKSRQLKGERALLLYPAGPDYVLSFFACLYAGIIAVPLYPPRRNRSADRLLAVIRDAAPAVILTTAAISNDIRSEFLAAGNGSITWIATDSIVAAESYTGWRPAGTGADDIAFLQYTSGSTGSPKGVMVTHRQLLENEKMIHIFADRRDAPVVISWLPLYHDMGLIGNLLYTLYAGGHAYLLSPFDFLQKPLRWLQAISTYRGTVSGGPDFAYEECVKRITAEQAMQLDLRSWKKAFNGAEPVNARTLERFSSMFRPAGFSRSSFMPCYGMAEATLIISGVKPAAPPALYEADAALLEQHILQPPARAGAPAVQLVCCGEVIEQEVLIVSENTVLPEERVGEIWVKGSNVAKGYWGNEAATAETFRAFLPDGRGPFLRTGDLGFIKAGALYVTGRLKELIIIRGRNIYPQDVERMAGTAHQALEAGAGAAFAIVTNGQEKLVIVQELKREYSAHAPAEEIMPAMRAAVAAQYDLQPHAIVLIRKGSLLRTSSGKIQRNACRQAFLSGEGLAVVARWQEAGAMPATPGITASDIRKEITYASVLQRLKTVISAYAGIPSETISEKDTFEQFGLDSTGAVYTATAMGEWLGIPVSPTLLYDYPGVSALAGFLHTAYTGGLQDMEAPIDSNSINVHAPVAVIGMGCRFPGGAGVDGFWQLLREGGNAVRKADPGRWTLSDSDERELGDMIRMGGFLPDVDAFDAAFFGITDEEAVMMDPQQRLLLEVSWEALEDAGIAPQSLAGKPVGVFTGISSGDYARLQAGTKALDSYHGTGNAGSIAANRLSYHYDLRGPSMAVDTACSSSLVAVHQACKSLQLQECSLAMAAGVNIMAAPDLSIIFARAGMLAPDGRCKTFDAAGNGYVRGEGCGMVILKRLEDAERDGDRIYGVIRGSAVNQDGRSNGLTAPNGPSQEAVMRKALMVAGMQPGEVDLAEAHGTGTALGDPVEMKALLHTYGVNRDRPLYVGAVKTNIGHLEAAAGIAGLIKALLCLYHRTVVPHLHLHTLNPHMPALPAHCEIPRQLHPLSPEGVPAAGVSSFGFGGTNAHVVLQAYPGRQTATVPHGPELLVISAAQQEQLVLQARQLLHHLQVNPQLSIKDMAGTLLQGRNRLPWCKAFVAADVPALKDKLEEYLSYATDPLIREESVPRTAQPRLAFMFTGQGAQYREMGKALYEQEAVFRHTFDHCSEVLASHIGLSISHLLYQEKDDEQIHLTAITQPLLVAFEISLARLWASWGVTPDAVMGHSIGEIAAAHIAGVFSLEDALLLTAIRGKLMQQLPPGGEMWAVSASAQVIEPVIRPLSAQVAIASFNAPEQIVISGDAQRLAGPLQVFREQGIRMVQLKVSHAFHSPLMAPAVAQFRDRISNIRLHSPRIPLLSNVSGQWAGPEICTPDYWAQHIVAPVRFSQGIQVMAAAFDCCCEMGPHPVLTGLARQSGVADKMVLLPGIINKSDNRADMLRSLGELYCLGYPVRAGQLYPPHSFRRVSLPGYPFLKTRYWISASPAQPAAVEEEPEWLYEKVWEAMPLQEAPAAGRNDLLLICTDQPSLIQLLLEDGLPLRRPFRILVPEALAGEEHTGRLLPFSPATWEMLLQEPDSGAPAPCTILFAMGLETPSTDRHAAIHTYLQTCCPLLLQALAGVGKVPFGKGDCRILLFTPPVAPVLPGVAVAPQAAVLHGMLRCVQHEMPEIQVCGITADVYNAGWWQTWLQTELDVPHMETEVAFRQGQRFVSRVKQQDRPAARQPAFRCNADQCWLLTGGNSEMSRSLVPWLLRKGARHFILAGRSAPREAQWQELQQAVAAAAGSIRWCRADISREQDLSLLQDCISAAGRPLQGILHLAGVLQDKPLFSLSWADMEPVLAPKVTGTLHLHQLSKQLEPEYFICFSSLAALLGAAYQANYAGANAFMDAFTYYRLSEGLPATSICWGPWEGAGMAATASSHQVAGVEVVRKTTAAGNIAALEQVLAAGHAHAAVIDFNPAAARLLPQAPFFQYLLEKWPAEAQPARGAASLMERLQAASVDELTGKLVALISREVKAVLGDRYTGEVGAEDTFIALGMDSVMTVALQQRLHRYLQLNFSVAAIYNYNTIRALAAFLAGKAAPQKAAPAHRPAPMPAARPQLKKRDLAAMSEEEAAALLDNLLSLKNI